MNTKPKATINMFFRSETKDGRYQMKKKEVSPMNERFVSQSCSRKVKRKWQVCGALHPYQLDESTE